MNEVKILLVDYKAAKNFDILANEYRKTVGTLSGVPSKI